METLSSSSVYVATNIFRCAYKIVLNLHDSSA